MKVILKKDVADLGQAGEIVEVADGYGNNYLMPRGLAMKATRGAIKDAEAIARARAKRAEASRADAEARKARLEASPVAVTAKAGEEGQLYGSVGVTALAKAIGEQLGERVDKKELAVPQPIKSVGTHEVEARIHRNVTATVTVEVAASDG